MANPIEIHGKASCPFAWRVRLAASEKGVPFDFIAFDADPPDARAAHNPDRRSPLLIHGARELLESIPIAHYLDEAFDGPPLQPADPFERAVMRVTSIELEGLIGLGAPGTALTDAQRARIEGTLDRLEQLLADGRGFVVGAVPSLADLLAWPFLAMLIWRRQIPLGAQRLRVAAYWSRVVARATFAATAPTWVPPQ